MSGARRASAVLRRAVRDVRAGRGRAALRELGLRAFSLSRSLLYERAAGEGEGGSESGVRVERVEAGDLERKRADLQHAGVLEDADLFARGAICYLAYRRDEAVGGGWRHARSRLLARLGFPAGAVYVGNFFVREEARGRGVYPALLLRMCRDAAGKGVRVCAQTSSANRASRRGLEKAGFRCAGELRVLVVAGCIVYARLWTS